MNFYSIRHLTRFRYSQPISESIMETRMHPRSDSNQHCLTFLAFSEPAMPGVQLPRPPGQQRASLRHSRRAQPIGDCGGVGGGAAAVARRAALSFAGCMGRAGCAGRSRATTGRCCCPALCGGDAGAGGAGETDGRDAARRSADLVLELNQRLFDYFDYVPRSTRVDSPIDEAIVSRKGVCQDFAHTMIALLRHVRIPARYVSGYLYRSREDHDRSTPDATHAWVEALLPHLGWVGFDPTNNLVAHHRHIRTAVGRDYADVPPTHGVFRGKTASELYVAVHVEASDATAGARPQAADSRRLERAGRTGATATGAAAAVYRPAADATQQQ